MLGLAVLGGVLPASAGQAEAFTWSWQAPPDCPSPEDVRAEVARLLGGEIRLPAGRDFRAKASVSHGQTWSVSIETELAGRPGRRSIEAASCQDLADATALILALTIDPDVAVTHPTRPKAPLPPSPSPLQPAQSPPPVPTSTQPAPRKQASSTDVLFGLQAEGSQGTLPSVDLGLGGSIGVVGRRYRVELRAAYGLRRDQIAHATTLPDAYGQFNFLAGVLAGCFNLGREALAFGPCADAEVGWVSAKGYGVSRSMTASRPWLAIGAGGYAAISLSSRWSVPLHLDVLAPVLRPEFVFKSVTASRVFQAPVVGVRVNAGIELRF
jgi:hypothetical protein